MVENGGKWLKKQNSSAARATPRDLFRTRATYRDFCASPQGFRSLICAPKGL